MNDSIATSLRLLGRHTKSTLFFLFAAVLLAATRAVTAVEPASPATSGSLTRVMTEPAFFIPTLGQTCSISFTAVEAGTAVISIRDRIGFSVRTLSAKVRPGSNTVTWDGRDAKGLVVPDEAYSVRIALTVRGRVHVLDPARGFKPRQEIFPNAVFSPMDGVLSYTLKDSSRVTVLVGEMSRKPGAPDWHGPFLKAVVNGKPRSGGAVIEKWSGFDESGTIRVAELPQFAIRVEAESLPPHSVITVGNRTTSYLDYVKARVRGGKLPPSLQDPSANLRVDLSARVVPGGYSLEPGRDLQVSVSGLETDSTAGSHPPAASELLVYLDDKRVGSLTAGQGSGSIQVASKLLSPGEHRVAANLRGGQGTVVRSFKLWVRPDVSSTPPPERP